MAGEFEMTRVRRLGNWLVSQLVLVGLPPGGTHLLATKGRKSGRIRTVPIVIVEKGGLRYLVAPYGEVNWVRNIRANPRIQLRQGRRVENLEAAPVESPEAGPVLKQYLSQAPITRSYFDADPEAPVAKFEKEADRHPVFRLVEPDQGTPDSTSSS